MINKKAFLKELRGWGFSIIGAFIILLICNTKVFASVRVQQSSMENTLLAGQKLIMDKISYNFSQPKRGDIIIFLEFKHKSSVKDEISIFLTDFENVLNLSTGNDRLVKRVIGVPGDTIDIKDGHVFVNNEMLEENYIKGETLKRETTFPIKVPEGKLFVLGDNRAVSRDSRNFGLVDSDQVEGKAVFRVWPYNKLGTVK